MFLEISHFPISVRTRIIILDLIDMMMMMMMMMIRCSCQGN